MRISPRSGATIEIVVALPALLTSRDLQAGVAAFLAVGIVVLGFLIFGRYWWGSLIVIGSVVMLTLLLAPDAYLAIGLGFALLLLAAWGAMLFARSRTLGGATPRLATPTR